ncbi:class I SAM-dependent methyltransferase [Luteimonas sp. S4-F44]|uniref:methyltransferase domain-containing protein n=1 Tax=Luteimonas sp. S4-F44 TaxID=2925842 RepID=UPI001F537BA4|nr:class I SAM-dependent methyltransferase [Luteimonas sp. S4-F44]UNK41495.1 class I SAM-dependent methyltransferase [Luteimonas sp. S4-F44]
MNAVASTSPDYFHALYTDDDPFGCRHRWYEARKRALLLASLPAEAYDAGWEIGCSNGELTVALAARCRTLLATDLDPRAVELARARTATCAGVHVDAMHHPQQWPTGTFDLIVLSEVGYYLAPDALDALLARLPTSLRDAGVFVACHWLHPFDEAPQNGRQVHAAIAQALGAPAFRYEDADLLFEGWSVSPHSVAQREALR